MHPIVAVILIAIGVPLFVAAASVALAAALVAATMLGLERACVTAWEVVRDRRAAPPVMGEDPASVAYLLGPVKGDVKAFFERNYLKNIADAQKAWAKMKSVTIVSYCWSAGDEMEMLNALFSEELKKAAWFVWAVVLCACGVLLTSITWLLGVLLLLPMAFVVVLVFSILYLIDRTYIWLRSYFAVCPACDTVNHKLHYVCRSCGRRHRHLYVNRMGALYHRCACKRRIPSHFLTGRGLSDQAYCSNEIGKCTQEIGRTLVTSTAVPVAIIGGSSSGKTVLMLAAVNWLLNSLPGISKAAVTFEDEMQEKDVLRRIADLRRGMTPAKTNAERHRAYTFNVDIPDIRQQTIYLFDPAGETFEDRELIEAHRFLPSTRAMIITVDPFSLRAIARRLQDRGEWGRVASEVAPSTLPVEDVISSLINALDRAGGRRGRDGRFTAPLVVMVTKTDAKTIEADIAEAVRRKSGLGVDAARDVGVRDWLVSAGAEPAIRLLETNFEHVCFFSGAPLKLGRSNEAGIDRLMRFVAARVLAGLDADPVLTPTATATQRQGASSL